MVEDETAGENETIVENKTRGANRKAKHKQLKINQEIRYLELGKMQMHEWTQYEWTKL